MVQAYELIAYSEHFTQMTVSKSFESKEFFLGLIRHISHKQFKQKDESFNGDSHLITPCLLYLFELYIRPAKRLTPFPAVNIPQLLSSVLATLKWETYEIQVFVFRMEGYSIPEIATLLRMKVEKVYGIWLGVKGKIRRIKNLRCS